MSFDTVFDYTAVSNGLTDEKAELDARITSLSSERDLLVAATEYASDPDVVARLSRIDTEISRDTTLRASINTIIAEITVVQGLDSTKKEDLYYFYTTVAASKQDFMARMLFNHNSALNDEKIARLRADLVTPTPARTVIAKLYYANYTPAPATIAAVYRYIV